MARQPTVVVAGALETEGGRAVANDLLELLESELVRFRHRVAHDHGISFERARAALVLLTRLVAAGAGWRAPDDAAPRKIFDSFIELMTRADASWQPGLAEALHVELAEFLDATKSVPIADPPAKPTLADRVRWSGAPPEIWWWTSQFDDLASCWRAAATSSDRLVALALAVGAARDRIDRSLAGAFAVAAARVKTRRMPQRTELVALLEELAAAGTAAPSESAAAKITSVAFQVTAAQDKDALGQLALLAFQLVEVMRASARPPDPERYAELAAKAQRTLHAHGVQLATVLKQDLEPLVLGTPITGSPPRRA